MTIAEAPGIFDCTRASARKSFDTETDLGRN